MERHDDRTKEQRQTHRHLITATDKFMSGWGKCANGLSKCAWACKSEDVDRVDRWVRNRSEMKYVGYQVDNWYPKNYEHLHIYVVDETHPAIN